MSSESKEAGQKMQSEGQELRWDSAIAEWGDKTYPVRPSQQELDVFASYVHRLEVQPQERREKLIAILGSTPEFRSLLSERGYIGMRAVTIDLSPHSFAAMTQLMLLELVKREKESHKLDLIGARWQQLPLSEKSTDLFLGDLVLNIVYDNQKGKETTHEQHITQQRMVLNEMARVITDEGVAMLRTWVLPPAMESSGEYRSIDDVLVEWEKFKQAQGIDINTAQDAHRRIVFSFFANRLIRHYQDGDGKFICSEIAQLLANGRDRAGRVVQFPDRVNEVMAWHWRTYTIPNWMLPRERQEQLFRERFDVDRITTRDDLSEMNPIYILKKSKQA